MSNGVADPSITVLILAGGQGRRLGGIDKSTIQIDGETQLQRWQRFALQLGLPFCVGRREAIMLGEIADDPRFGPAAGPVACLAAAASAISTPWIFSLPVDTLRLPGDLLARFAERVTPQSDVVYLSDMHGKQPLLAFWRTQALRQSAEHALHRNDRSVRALQAPSVTLDLAYPQWDFGNLNEPADLVGLGTIPT